MSPGWAAIHDNIIDWGRIEIEPHYQAIGYVLAVNATEACEEKQRQSEYERDSLLEVRFG